MKHGSDVDGVVAMQMVWAKLERCKSKLQRWSREKFGKNECLIKDKTIALTELQELDGPEHNEAIKALQQEIDTLLEFKDIRWKQRVKQSWYRDGNRNTPFFHAWASHHRRINTIKRVINGDGREMTKVEDISDAFVSYYNGLFTTKGTTGMEEFTVGLKARVTIEMNARLVCRFEECEVDRALAQMHLLKSSSLDGLSASFYQNSWSMVRKDICNVAL